MRLYHWLARIFPTKPPPENPRRIVLIRPCCIGDVMMATATLKALRDQFPTAHITWAVNSWSRAAIEGHDLLDAILDTGADANPARLPLGWAQFALQLRGGKFDMAVLLVRSPLMSLAVLLSGIPHRIGLDSDGRGFGYTVRVPVDPDAPRHEAEIYLDAARALGIETDGYSANVPIRDRDRHRIRQIVGFERYIVINPAGGNNPGMTMTSKRYPTDQFAQFATRLAKEFDAKIVLIGGPGDADLVSSIQITPSIPTMAFVGSLTFGEIAALANQSVVYVGNDTGLTHLAAAAGARTVMILGPSDPARYAPFTSKSLAVWKPTAVSGGVSSVKTNDFDWSRNGVSVEDAFEKIRDFLADQA
jgi:ADP-heptose:LPS heptosyltransferase